MKTSKWIMLGVIALAGIGLSGCGNDAESEANTQKGTEVKVGTGNDGLPYCYLNEEGEYDGYDVQVVKAIDEKLEDYYFTFQGGDFPTTLSNLESKKVDFAAYEYEINEERQEKFTYGDVGYVVWDTYIVTDSTQGAPIDSFEELKGKKVYVTTATNQAAMAEAYLAENDGAFELVYGEYTPEQIVQSVTSGAVDATLAPKYQVDTYNRSFDVALETGEKPVHKSDAYLLFNKETDKELMEAINGALTELIADGTISEISEEYLQGDYVPKANEKKG
ncbi:amino acid ABC transporter substrate-binding protein [Enterococcus florum]|uniref:Amino acid ABC transporter substrate-binding protein n=1 Tax=Enterococcus florum TaxID=2480627 RepID=A0A4P5P937_9ENTE|nr:transporter substrate-binding domain-containing protein [Enterococcus florum]GCF94066.1 amino acid ABC transporter substrate-binding protein [Enterococcus florum]